MRNLEWSMTKSCKDPRLTRHGGSISDLVDMLRAHGQKYLAKDGPAIVAGIAVEGEGRTASTMGAVGNWRQHHLVIGLDMLILDVDGCPLSPSEVVALSPWYCVHYSSPSHGLAEKPGTRMRLILPLSRRITPAELPDVWGWVVAGFERRARVTGWIDRQCTDAARIMYTPRKQNPKSTETPWVEVAHSEAGWLDPDEVLGEVVQERREAAAMGVLPLDAPKPKPATATTKPASSNRGEAAVRAIIAARVEAIDAAPEGSVNQTGNTAAYTVGGYLHYAPQLEGEARRDLAAALVRRGHPQHRADVTINSGLTAGQQSPLELPERDRTQAGKPYKSESVKPVAMTADGVALAEVPADDPASGPWYDQRWDAVWNSIPSETDLAQRLLSTYTRPRFDDGEGQVVSSAGSLWRYRRDGLWVEIDRAEVIARMSRWNGQLVGSEKPKPIRLQECHYSNAIKLLRHGILRPDDGFFGEAPRGFAAGADFFAVDFDRKTIQRVPLAASHKQRHRLDCDLPPDVLGDAPAGWLYGPKGSLLNKYLSTCHKGAADEEDRLLAMGQLCFVALTQAAARYHRAVMVYSPIAGTGKSQFVELIRSLVPEGASTSLPPAQMADERFVGRLSGAWLNAVTEVGDEMMEPAIFKALVSGERVMAKFLYQQPFEFVPQALHVFAGNQLPRIRGGSDQAIWDRWITLRFDRRVRDTAEDIKDIGKAIAATEMQHLVAWAIRCGRVLMHDGAIRQPVCSQEIEHQWRLESDPVAAWLDEVGAGDATSAARTWPKQAEVYREFGHWLLEQGFSKMSSRTFATRLEALGVARAKSDGHPRVCVSANYRGEKSWSPI